MPLSYPGPSIGFQPWPIPLSMYTRFLPSWHQAVLMWNSKTSQKKHYLTMSSLWLWMIWMALLLTLVTLPTSLCMQRLRDTKIQYDNIIPSLNSAVSNPCLKDAPLLTWKQYWDKYIDACLTFDGQRQHDRYSTGSKCQRSNLTFCCCDWFGLVLYCKACIINYHCNEPLHFLEVLLLQPY